MFSLFLCLNILRSSLFIKTLVNLITLVSNFSFSNDIGNLFFLYVFCCPTLEDTDEFYWWTRSLYDALIFLEWTFSLLRTLLYSVLLLDYEESYNYFSMILDGFFAGTLSSLYDLWIFIVFVTTSVLFQLHLIFWD